MMRMNKLRCMAVCVACILMLSFAGLVLQADAAGTKTTQDEVQLTEKNGKIEVSVGIDHASEEQMTAVSLTLRIDVTSGKEKVSFTFPKELKDAVTGSRYKDGYLHLYVANDSGIFDAKDNKLVLGNLKIDAKDSKKGVNAVVCYVEDSLKAVNSAYGDRVVKNAAYSTAITVNQVSNGTESEDPGSDDSEKPDDESKESDSTGTSDGTSDGSKEDQTKDKDKDKDIQDTKKADSSEDSKSTKKDQAENTSEDLQNTESTGNTLFGVDIFKNTQTDTLLMTVLITFAVLLLVARFFVVRRRRKKKNKKR